MAYNQNLVQTEEVVFTTTSLVLGFGSGQTVPPRYIVCEPTNNMTITLPLSTPSLPTSAANQYVPGAGPGYPITIYNNSSTPYTVTIVAASGDTLQNVSVLTLQNSSISVFASPSENIWYGFGLQSGAAATAANTEIKADRVVATSTSFTLWTADAAYIVTGATAVWGTASSSGTLQLEKATGTQATGSGTNLLTGTVDLSTAANTVNSGTLVATAATLTFASGNRLNAVLGGTLTGLANCCITVGLRRLV